VSLPLSGGFPSGRQLSQLNNLSQIRCLSLLPFHLNFGDAASSTWDPSLQRGIWVMQAQFMLCVMDQVIRVRAFSSIAAAIN
jgi:hypothetical protein